MLRKSVQIILDVPTVGGRLMLVDMAGSENIEQAGQIGFEAKMQVRFVNTYVFVPSVFAVHFSNFYTSIQILDSKDQPGKHCIEKGG